jgi:hypothetical protein
MRHGKPVVVAVLVQLLLVYGSLQFSARQLPLVPRPARLAWPTDAEIGTVSTGQAVDTHIALDGPVTRLEALVAHQSSARPADRFNVKEFGARGDCSTDDTAAINRAITAAGNGIVYLPQTPACYRISAPLAIPPDAAPIIEGAGIQQTVVRQTSATADGIDFAETPETIYKRGIGGGVRDLTIEAGASTYPEAWQSSGIGLLAQGLGNGFLIENVRVLRFARGAVIDTGWNAIWDHVYIQYAREGITYGCHTGYPQGAGTRFTNVLIADGQMSAPKIGPGFHSCGGTPYLDHVEVDGFGSSGVLIRPKRGQVAEGIRMIDVLADTSAGPGLVLDGTQAPIAGLTANNLWAGFNNGAGIVLQGSHLQGVSLQGQFRENGSAGIYIVGAIHPILTVANSQINSNARGVVTLISAGAGCRNGDRLRFSGGAGGPIIINVVDVTARGALLPAYGQGWDVNSSQYYSKAPTNPVSVTGGHCTTEPRFKIVYFPKDDAGFYASGGSGDFVLIGNTLGNFASSSVSEGASVLIDSGNGNNFIVSGNFTANGAGSFSAIINNSTNPACIKGRACRVANNLP